MPGGATIQISNFNLTYGWKAGVTGSGKISIDDLGAIHISDLNPGVAIVTIRSSDNKLLKIVNIRILEKINATTSNSSNSVNTSRASGEGIATVTVNGTDVKVVAENGFSGVTKVDVVVSDNGQQKSISMQVTVLPQAPANPVADQKKLSEIVFTWDKSPNAISYLVKVRDETVCETKSNFCLANVIVGPTTPIMGIVKGNDGTESKFIPVYQINKPVPAITVNFATNSYVLNAKQKSELDAIALVISKEGFTRLVVYGYTDSRGGVDNQKLSENRAKATASYLSKLLPNVTFKVAGFGASKPIASNATTSGLAENRRAELSLW